LKANHRPGETVLMPTLGPANLLTLLRGLLLGLLAGFLAAPWPSGGLAWLPAGLYTLAIVVDVLDGYVARRMGDTTLLGGTLDIEFDALGLLIATGLAVHYRQLPGWYLVLGLSRYLFLFGIWWRQRQGKPIYDMTPSVHRRMVASFHMSFMSVMLWPLMRPPATTLAGLVFALPFTASFVRDWLVVSGRLDPTSATYLEARRRLAGAISGWLPLALRVGVAAVTLGLILPAITSTSQRAALFGWPGMPFPQSVATAISLVALAGAGMLVAGAAGRLAALGVLFAAAANIHTRGLDLVNGLWLAASIALLFLGSGMLACWRPEEAALFRRAGEKKEATSR
jgi:CDP-diacylglycerol--glycerol-3-phosphate 3-phosphatidyltransferase